MHSQKFRKKTRAIADSELSVAGNREQAKLYVWGRIRNSRCDGALEHFRRVSHENSAYAKNFEPQNRMVETRWGRDCRDLCGRIPAKPASLFQAFRFLACRVILEQRTSLNVVEIALTLHTGS
jgi:hypothetical protein